MPGPGVETGRFGALRRHRVAGTFVQVEGHYLVSVGQQALGQSGAHFSETDHADPHWSSFLVALGALAVPVVS